MSISVYLYDAQGRDRQIPFGEASDHFRSKKSIVWFDIEKGDEREIAELEKILKLERNCLSIAPKSRPSLKNYGDYFCFDLQVAPCNRPQSRDATRPKPVRNEMPARVVFAVGSKWMVTNHDQPANFLEAFRDQDKAQTLTGLLSPHALAAALLDWHLGEFFEEVSDIEEAVDELDEAILRDRSSTMLLGRSVLLRRRVSILRKLLVSHRDVFYGLSRPDLMLAVDETATEFLRTLSSRFERAVDEVEHSKDSVNGSLELFTSYSSQQTNDLVKILTLVTVIIGFCAAVAGLLGMNFELSIFKTGYVGFAAVTGGLIACGLAAMLFARIRKWI